MFALKYWSNSRTSPIYCTSYWITQRWFRNCWTFRGMSGQICNVFSAMAERSLAFGAPVMETWGGKPLSRSLLTQQPHKRFCLWPLWTVASEDMKRSTCLQWQLLEMHHAWHHCQMQIRPMTARDMLFGSGATWPHEKVVGNMIAEIGVMF